MARQQASGRMGFETASAYVIAFTVATFAFAIGLIAGNPVLLGFAAWIVLSIGIALVRRATGPADRTGAESAFGRLGLDGWAVPAILALGVVALVAPLVFTLASR